MYIDIDQSLKPFTHIPGTWMLLPNSSYCFQVFPTRLVIADLNGHQTRHVDFDFPGPIEGFTAQVDLKHGWIHVFGNASSKRFSYYVDTHAVIHTEKKEASFPLIKECLSLGSHKLQDFDLIRRRRDFTEIFPIWHALGFKASSDEIRQSQGMYSLLERCQTAISANAPEHVLSTFRQLFVCGFKGILVPRLFDEDFNGIIKSYPETNDALPIQLLQASAKLIRSLFFQQRENQMLLLPCLPPEFHCGKLMHVMCAQEACLNIEWTSKQLRRMTFFSLKSQELSFHFSKKQSCRLRHSTSDKGVPYKSGTLLKIESAVDYWFDNFQSC